jgi:DNA-binding response OmpR family regulator
MTVTGQANPCKILIIEEDMAEAWLIKRLVARVGDDVRITTTSQQGQAMIEQDHPDLIIFDWALSDSAEQEAAQRVQAMLNNENLRILILYSNNSVTKPPEPPRAGRKYLLKPLQLEDLDAARQAILSGKTSGDVVTQDKLRPTHPRDENRFWCPHCKKEFQEKEVEIREVDGMFGEGRWFHCRTCGSRLIAYPSIGAPEREIILRTEKCLAQIQEFGELLSPDETCRLLLDIGQLYHANGSYREACLALFNTRKIAELNNLPEVATEAGSLFDKLAYMFNLQDQKIVSLRYLFQRFIAYYIPQ